MRKSARSFEEQAGGLTQDDIRELATRLPKLRERFARLNVVEHRQLVEQYEFLALLVEDYSEHLACKVSVVCSRELAFALLYLETRDGLLPDDAPGLGLTDKQAVVATVLHKHRQALRTCPRGCLFRWEVEPVDFDRLVLNRLHQRLSRLRLNGLPQVH